MDNRITNRANAVNSFQISVIGSINEANFKLSDGKGGELGFLIKNITDEPITVEIVPYSMDTAISTVMYPGWNVEIVREVKSNIEGLQYGY